VTGAARAALVRAADDLRVQIEALTAQLGDIVAANRTSNSDDEHDPEGPTIAFERAQVAAVLDSARRRLAEVEAALRRVDEGGYGVCEGCGRPIPAARLEVRPAARTCVACA
jgi:RNA polymerase-binding transcription factor DksA